MTENETEAGQKKRKVRREKRPAKPLDETRLRDLALHYAARYATTAAKLEAYLIRKIRERGLAEEDEPTDMPAMVDGIVARLVELKYVDDEAYAKARTGSLLRRGYGKRRVAEDLRHAGVDEHTREDTSPDAFKSREAAMTLARKRRFGPYTPDRDMPSDDAFEERAKRDPAQRQKQIAAMLRAGHSFDTARIVIDASSVDALEEWLAEVISDQGEHSGEGWG